MSFCRYAPALLSVLFLAACGKSPEKAKAELELQQIAITEKSLVEQSKLPAAQENATNLIAAGVDPNARQENGMTALMAAALSGQKETVAELLKRKADLEIEARGYTALITAVSGGNKDIVELLLAKGANVNHKTSTGQTALRAARGGKHPEIEQMLMKAGARE